METRGGRTDVGEVAADASFNFAALLLKCGEQQDWERDHPDPEGLFSRSPLTSLESSPNPSAPGSPLSSVPSSRATTPPPTIPPTTSAPRLRYTQASVTPSAPLSSRKSRAARLQKNSHMRSRKDRGDRRRTETRDGVREKHVDAAPTIRIKSRLGDSSVTKGGYTASRSSPSSKLPYRLRELIGKDSKFQFRRVRWDGRTPMRIVDRDRRLVAVLAGAPPDGRWSEKMLDAADLMDRLRPSAYIGKVKGKKKPNRRGNFIALKCGVSHGGGQTRPKNLTNHRSNQRILNKLQAAPFFHQTAGFASGVLKYWAPKLFARYEKVLQELRQRYPDITPNFAHSVFAASSYNLGPTTVCYEHTDFSNLPFGLCAVTSLGTFNPRRGGHLVLKQCRLVIEFPPGSTILLPSAIVAHSNTRISPGERRYSVAQYTAGPLFRWVDNDFKKATVYDASLSKAEKAAKAQRDAQRWLLGLEELPVYNITSEPPHRLVPST